MFLDEKKKETVRKCLKKNKERNIDISVESQLDIRGFTRVKKSVTPYKTKPQEKI